MLPVILVTNGMIQKPVGPNLWFGIMSGRSDLKIKTVEAVVLPLCFYSLKDVAGYIGYKWDDPEAGGAESVVWYNEWLETKSDSVLKRILKYNEDDVRATLAIKEWLVQQGPVKRREKLEE